jgi:hypothetical protein
VTSQSRLIVKLHKLKLGFDPSTATVLLLTILVIAAASYGFEVLSFGWLAWCALGWAAIVILWPEVVEVVRAEGPQANAWSRIVAWVMMDAVHVAFLIAIAAVVDAPSIKWLALFMSGLYLQWTLVEWTVGRAEREPVYKAVITHRGKPAIIAEDVAKIKTEIER